MIGIKNVIAIICGGGPAPGINSVISAVVSEATRHGWDVLGIYDGFSRLARGEKNYVRLEPASISRIHLTGGCILKMSRFNPTKKESDLRTVVETLTELGVTHVVTIGGDDTAFSSMAVSEYARKMGRTINVVHVPKTIDNDLPLPEGVPTFGFETARAFGTMEIENLMEDASTTNNRWYFTIAMGRTAGHLALGMGRSAGAAITIIPEEFAQDKIPLQQVVDVIVGSIVKRYLTGRNYGVAMLVGAAGAMRLSRRVRGGVLLLAATAVTVSATAGLALVPSVPGRALLLVLLFCAAPIMNAVGGGYVMRLIPTGMFGRVGGALLLINLGLPAAAPWLAGRGLDAVGRSGTLWGFTALGSLALGLMLASRRLRTLGLPSQWDAADEAP